MIFIQQPDDWPGFVHRVGRLFFNARMDTRDISLKLGFDEATVARAVNEYRVEQRSLSHESPKA